MKLTKQDLLHVQNILMLMGKGKFELTGQEIQFANKAIEFLVRLRDEGDKEIIAEEAAMKAAEVMKAAEIKKTLESTKAVIESLIPESPVELKIVEDKATE